MSIFNNNKSKFRVKTEVRRVVQAVEKPKPQRLTSSSLLHNSNPTSSSRASLSAPPSARGTPRASPNPTSSSHSHSKTSSSRHLLHPPSSSSPEPASTTSMKRKSGGTTSSSNRLLKRGRAGRSSRSPAATASPAPLLSDSEPGSDDDDDDWRDRLYATNKRPKRAHTEDPGRRVRHPLLWVGETGEGQAKNGEGRALSGVVHAAEVSHLGDRCKPLMGLAEDEVAVELRYPGSNVLERYELVNGTDKIDGAEDVLKVVKFVASVYLTDAQAKPFVDHNTGIIRRLEKSKNTRDGHGFKAALREFNKQLLGLQKKGAIAENIDAMRGVPTELAWHILTQVYDRTVAPKVDLLKKYENGTDNIYGELLHPFVSDIFDRTQLTSDMVFVDLGSGVANVTLQAALERGCKSWGCEMMDNACNLAEAQKAEFSARCGLWGIAPGEVHLERGDFRKNERTLAALKRADVVLVNNQAFTAALNDNLVSMFLDLKIGCKIVSLKTFVHDNKIAENDVASSILEVERLTYPPDYVSWTNNSGNYYISTRK